MNGANVKQLYESLGPQGFYDKVSTCLREGELKPEQIDLKEMFLGMCGERAYSILGEKHARRHNDPEAIQLAKYGDSKTGEEYNRLEESAGWTSDPSRVLREAGEAVDVSAFSAITGQIAYNYIAKGWNNAEMVGDRIFRNMPTEFSGQKIPWLSNLFGPITGDQDIHAGMDYPEATFGPRYITTPRVFKKGAILSISLEFMLFDRTGQAGSMGLEKLGAAVRYSKEYMQLRVFMGYNPVGALSSVAGSPYGYNLNNTYLGTYLTSGSNYVNALGSTPLTDWTSVNQAIYLRSKILDPDSGRPIALGPGRCLFVMPQQMMLAKRILTATGTQSIYPGYSVSNPAAPGNVKFDSGNPITWNLDLFTSPIAYQILLAATTNPAAQGSTQLTTTQINAFWWYGDFNESFAYAEIFPFKSEQAIAGNIREFQSDIKLRFKVSEMGVPFVYDPRFTAFFYNT